MNAYLKSCLIKCLFSQKAIRIVILITTFLSIQISN